MSPQLLLSLDVPPVPSSVPRVRHALEAALGPLVASGDADGGACATAALLLSELVTNSVQHAGLRPGESVQVEARLHPGGRLHVSVHDEGPGFTATRVGMPPPDAPGGRGIPLLDVLADDWGAERTGSMRVWFELHLRDGAAAAG